MHYESRDQSIWVTVDVEALNVAFFTNEGNEKICVFESCAEIAIYF